VSITSTKAEGECHSSIFYGLFENEKVNKWHVATINNTAEKKEGNKQESVNDDAFIFDFTYYHSLKNMEMVFFIWMVVFISLFLCECGRRDATQERESTHDDDDNDDDDWIKEEANANAFIFDSTHYQSWKSMTVVFFQNAGNVVVCNVVENRVWTTFRDMSESTHDDNNNDNDTTTINRKWFTKLKYNNCLSLLVWLMSFIKLSFLFVIFQSIAYDIQYSIRNTIHL
jgi:hypothetical protein